MKKYSWITLISLFSIFTFSLVSCDKDKDEGVSEMGTGIGNSPDFTINNKQYNILFASCHEYDGDDGGTIFFADVYYEGELVNFELDLNLKKLSQLKEGMELINMVKEIQFYMYMSIYKATGSVKVKEITGSTITLQFNNFTFLSDVHNRYKYVINGPVTYDYIY